MKYTQNIQVHGTWHSITNLKMNLQKRLKSKEKQTTNNDKVQGFLAVVLGLVTIACVVTGVVKPYPTDTTWSWGNAGEWYSETFFVCLLVAIFFYPVFYR